MKLTDLLALYANPEATDEQKQTALAEYEEANKPQEADTSELDELKAAVQKLTENNASLLTEKQKAKQQAEEAARASMTSEELKADYEKRLNDALTGKDNEWTGKYQSVLDQLKQDKVEGQALKLASALSDSPEAILPHIQSRIGFEVGDNGFEVFVKGQDGKRTAATFDELQSEIAETPYLKGVLKSSFTNTGTTEVTQQPTKSPQNPAQGAKDSLAFLNSVAQAAGE
ncbi:coil containing protein [Vibrio phage 1.047.O._10N.286.55.F2]|nr:coil containing protein [Vibrio phage 1.047.O._10N.286.55.F2]